MPGTPEHVPPPRSNRELRSRVRGVNDELPAMCWCGLDIVHVDPAVIRRGETGTCHRRSCILARDGITALYEPTR